MSPDPKTVREIAEDAIREGARTASIEDVLTGHPVVDHDDPESDYDAWFDAIAAQVHKATVTVEWPDEQQPADVVTAEQQPERIVPELTEELLRTLPVPIAAAVWQLMLREKLRDQQLAAATARAEKAEALAAELGDEWGVQSEDSERAQPCDDEDHARHLADRYSRFRLPGGERTQYRVVRRLATEWCDTETADASPDGRSGPVERSETSGGHGEGSNSSTGTAGLSELHAFVVCAACNGSGGYCQRCREGQAGLPHSAHIVTCPDCLGGGTYPPATEDGR